MAEKKSVQVRVLVAFALETEQYKPNQVVVFTPSEAATLKALGYVDDDKAAVAYGLKIDES